MRNFYKLLTLVSVLPLVNVFAATDSTGITSPSLTSAAMAYFSANFPAFSCTAITSGSPRNGDCAAQFDMSASTTIINGFVTPTASTSYLVIPTTAWYKIMLTFNVYNPSVNPTLFRAQVLACQDATASCTTTSSLVATSDVTTLTNTDGGAGVSTGYISLAGGSLQNSDNNMTLTKIVRLTANWTIPIYLLNASSAPTFAYPEFIVPFSTYTSGGTTTYTANSLVITGGTFTIQQLP